jgi:hypothetical protein
MEYTALIARLEAAKRRAKLGQDQIDRQRMVVATLFASGSETTEAENRLRIYEKLHDNYLADVERILNALNPMPQADLVRLPHGRAERANTRTPAVMSPMRSGFS